MKIYCLFLAACAAALPSTSASVVGEMSKDGSSALNNQHDDLPLLLDVDEAEGNLEEGDDPPTHLRARALANWDLTATPQTDGSINLSWMSEPGADYEICWKLAREWWASVCKGPHKTEIRATDYYSYHIIAAGGIVTCGTEYKIKVQKKKRPGTIWSSASDSTTVTTAPCGCANPCPKGGYYDSANCQIGQPPPGTTAFIWGAAYYYTPEKSGNSTCPYPGSVFDSENCFASAVPPGVVPFIWDNSWY